MLFIACVCAFVLQSGFALDFYASFDISASNSVFNAVGGAGAHLFVPAQAIAPGSGYWCSAPNRADEVLSELSAWVRCRFVVFFAARGCYLDWRGKREKESSRSQASVDV
jgi:hypothetical protein